MNEHVLIDLFFPATAGSPEEAVGAAAKANLDAIVYAVDAPDDLPEAEAIDAINGADGPRLYPGLTLLGPGYRMMVLLADWAEANCDVLEATTDLDLLQQAAAEMGGCIVPVCPRQDGGGGVLRETAPIPAEPAVGIVAMVAGGNMMGRDLDIEDAGATQRRVLGATGPFGTAEDVGRYATLVPADANDIAEIIEALGQGFGVAVEIQSERGSSPQGGKKKRRRRRRRRRPRKDGDGGGGSSGD